MIFIVVSVVVCLLGIGAFMSAAETAITATSPGRIQNLKSNGNKAAGVLLRILKLKDKAISTLLIGNSIANTLCTTISTSLFIEILGDDLGTVVSSIVMSFLIIVFSEVIPKAIAVSKAEKIALRVTPVLVIFLKVFNPINILLSHTVKLFCFLFRIDLNQKLSATDEVRGVIEHYMHEGNVYKDDREMLSGILDIRHMEISDIMVHRSKIIAININTSQEKIIKTVLTSPHSRFPFWEDTSDNIIGVLHVKDLMNRLLPQLAAAADKAQGTEDRSMLQVGEDSTTEVTQQSADGAELQKKSNKLHNSNQNQKQINIRDLLSPPVFVPDNSLVMQQLHMFRKGQTHLACVVDEYGDLQGIITLEDILEEIVGQIYDEHDSIKNKISQVSDRIFIIDGSVPIRDLNRELNWQIPETEATTIAGFIINKMKKIPNQEEYLIDQNLKMIVKQKSENRIKTIKVIVLEDKDLDSD